MWRRCRVPQRDGDLGHAHRHAGMAGLRGFDGVHRQRADRVGKLRVGGARGGGGDRHRSSIFRRMVSGRCRTPRALTRSASLRAKQPEIIAEARHLCNNRMFGSAKTVRRFATAVVSAARCNAPAGDRVRHVHRRSSAASSRATAGNRFEGTTNGRNPSVRRMVRLPCRHAGIHAAPKRCATLCIDAARGRRADVVGDSFYQFEPQGVTGTVLLAESHLADPHVARGRLRHGRRLRLQLTTDNTAKAERVFRALEAALKPRAHALPGDPSRGQGCLSAGRRRASGRRHRARRDDRVPDRRLGLLRPVVARSSRSSARRSRRSRFTTPRRSASCSASTAIS